MKSDLSEKWSEKKIIHQEEGVFNFQKEGSF